MRKIYITIFITTFCAVLSACTANRTSRLIKPQKAESEETAGDLKKNMLEKGRMLAGTECRECHRYYSPEEYTSEKWEEIIKRKSQRLSLRKDQAAALEAYFQSESSSSE